VGYEGCGGGEPLFKEKGFSPSKPPPFLKTFLNKQTAADGLLDTTVCRCLFKRFAFERGEVFRDSKADTKAKLTSVSGQGLGGA